MHQAARLQGRLRIDGKVPKKPWVILVSDGPLVWRDGLVEFGTRIQTKALGTWFPDHHRTGRELLL